MSACSTRSHVGARRRRTPEQRCWVERQDVVRDNGNANVPAPSSAA
jgi:hypothetical protein